MHRTNRDNRGTRRACAKPLRLASALVAIALLWAAACGPKRTYVAVPVPGWDEVRELFPQPPAELEPGDAARFEEAWAALHAGALEKAAKEMERLARRYRTSADVAAALGFVDLRLGLRDEAERRFDAALARRPDAAPALAGRFLLALAEGDEEGALAALRRLADERPEHPFVAELLPTLELQVAENKLQQARRLRAEGRWAAAAEAYREALRVVPGASGLYQETAEVELEAGEIDAALDHASRAIEETPRLADPYRIRAEAYRAKGDLRKAIEDYRRAVALDPDDAELAARYESARREFERENLPAEFAEIERSWRLTREQLAALLYVKLRDAFDRLPPAGGVIATDIADSWAREPIRRVVAAGILTVLPNHTFQPRAFVTRAELARALAAAVDVLAPSLRQEAAAEPQPRIADVPVDNIHYRAIALGVRLGLFALDEQGRFDPLGPVDGAEAVRAVEALAERMGL